MLLRSFAPPAPAPRFFLRLRELRVRLHFFDLLRVPFAVGRNHQYPLVSVEFLAHGTIRCVVSQTLRILQESDRLRAAFLEML